MSKVFPALKKRQGSGPLLERSAPFMDDIVVTKEGVTKLLKGQNPSKALGPDELLQPTVQYESHDRAAPAEPDLSGQKANYPLSQTGVFHIFSL